MASTTSVDNSGLLGQILPIFKKSSGIDVHVVALGTGQALDTARRGDADLVLVHDPDAEDQFMKEGHGVTRREIAWNDFIIVGPKADPAQLKGSHDVVAGFKKIWAAGAPFVCAATRAAPMRWKSASGRWPTAIRPRPAPGSRISVAEWAPRSTPRRGSTPIRSPIAAPGSASRTAANLAIALEGDLRLLNRYDVIELNPKLHPTAKLDLAKKFADWLVSKEGQDAIGAYTLEGEKLFHPEADPKPTNARRPKAEILRYGCPFSRRRQRRPLAHGELFGMRPG